MVTLKAGDFFFMKRTRRKFSPVSYGEPLKSCQLETWAEVMEAVARVTVYWSAHKHSYVGPPPSVQTEDCWASQCDLDLRDASQSACKFRRWA
jgi:hypothetical protein